MPSMILKYPISLNSTRFRNEMMRWFILFIHLLPLSLWANTIVIQDGTEFLEISSELAYVEDANCELTFEEVQGLDFIENNGLLNFGVSRSCFWIRFEVQNLSAEERFKVSLEHPILDDVQFFTRKGLQNKISAQESFYLREYSDPNFIFDIDIPTGESRSYYLKIASNELIVLPVNLGTTDKILSISNTREMLFGLYAGIILVMFIYNLFVYFSVRDRSYLYYVLYIAFIGLTQASLKGYTMKYVWPEFPLLNQYSITTLSLLTNIFALEFVKDFLHSREFDLRWHKVSYIIQGVFLLGIIMNLSGLNQESFSLMQASTAIGSIYAFVLALRILRKGFRPAKFFLIAWSILLCWRNHLRVERF